jgi:hypothetical protein
MKIGYKIAIIVGALAACLMSSSAQAQVQAFQFYFDENGNAHYNVNGGLQNVTATWAMVQDPNTGITTLTYLLPNQIGTGIVDIADPTGALSDALSFFNANGNGYMAYYSFDSDGYLADIGPRVPEIFLNKPVGATENANDTFAYFSGGTQGADNDYYGVSGKVPDAGSTLAMLGGALALLGAAGRKLRK